MPPSEEARLRPEWMDSVQTRSEEGLIDLLDAAEGLRHCCIAVGDEPGWRLAILMCEYVEAELRVRYAKGQLDIYVELSR